MGQRLSCVVVKKDRQHNCYTPAYPKKMLPTFYQTHLQKQLAPAQFILLTILLNLIQSEKQVRLERLARVFPYPITTESRRRKLQRFLDLPQLTIALLWHPLIAYWLTTYCPVGESLSIAIDRSQWGCINLFTIALIWQKRAIPLYWSLLPKLGNSNLQEQILGLEQVIPLLKKYKVIVLGDREFCSVDLGNWRCGNGCVFLLEAKKKSLSANRNINVAALRPIRISTRNFVIFPRSKGQENAASSRI
jgi:hypothetical protein